MLTSQHVWLGWLEAAGTACKTTTYSEWRVDVGGVR
jgi:hypothetical protein